MKRFAILSGDTHSSTHDVSSRSKTYMCTKALEQIGTVEQFTVDNLTQYWDNAHTFSATVPMLYPLSADERQILRQLTDRNIPHLFSPYPTHTLLSNYLSLKERLIQARIRTPAFSLIKGGTLNLKFPVALYALSQPAVGMWHASSKKDLEHYLPIVRERHPDVLAERLMPGLRYCVSVIEDRIYGVRALPPVYLRAIPDSERSHYDDPYTEEICPTDLPIDTRRAMQDAAMQAHAAIGARHFSHSYFLVGPEGMWLTSITHSLVSDDVMYCELAAALRAANMTFDDLMTNWVKPFIV